METTDKKHRPQYRTPPRQLPELNAMEEQAAEMLKNAVEAAKNANGKLLLHEAFTQFMSAQKS